MFDIALVIPLFQISATVIVGIGLIFTSFSFLRTRKGEEIKTADTFNDRLTQFDKELGELDARKATTEEIRLWMQRVFNTFEWFSFLINTKQISNRRIIEYFDDTIVKYHEDVFVKYGEDKFVSQHKEFTKLYNNVKKNKNLYLKKSKKLKHQIITIFPFLIAKITNKTH